ncbi:helix-turn-helix domain-containing protein [Frateuria soli]|uniref:helix-turn-helix domain-containing protein n=1 Tax=Frateuria soli TaxID=1542730 RepID=UPI001E5E2DE4|nr:helix-turn-helix domain-containing protein [Frateuria soli]UGB39647.1 helix-turn-helix domain-containing protein [Frateuria soli]
MTFQQSNPGHRAIDLFAVAAITDGPSNDQSPSFGSRLRAARQARGLDLDACAHVLKLPARVLRQLESNQREGIDYAVYLASYITKYARHLGMDEDAIQAELASLKRAEPTLVATGGMSHSRYLLERYATAATYVVLTAVIVVPMVWLGVRGTLDRDLSHLAPLDATPVAQQDAPAQFASDSTRTGAATTASKPAVSPAEDQPLMASMAPFPGLDGGSLTAAKPQAATTAPAPVAAVPGGHSVSLTLAEASWVEVVAADGSRLEYGLLPAGASKTWNSAQPLDVRIGNAGGAKVSIDGQPLPLDAYCRANVAHFRVQDGKPAPSGA